MQLYDLTLPVSPLLPVWPGDPPILVEALSRVAEGAPYTVSRLSLSVHAGTHVDAPAHFLAAGATVDALPLATLVGPAQVVDVAGERDIAPARLAQAHGGPWPRRVLLKTGWAARLRQDVVAAMEDFPTLTPGTAAWLTARGVALVGIESPSVERFAEGAAAPVHRHLLTAQVVIVESLDLSDVAQGEWMLACLPLRLVGSEGAPARVVAWRE